MTPERAVEVLTRHFEAVRRGDPQALAIDRELTEIRARDEAREVRINALRKALHSLTDDGLTKVEALVASLPRNEAAEP